MHNMMFHISRSPAALQHAVDNEMETFAPILEHLRNNPKSILVIATGSSLNAAAIARPWFERVTGLPLDSIEPFTFISSGGRPGSYDLILVVSQRGTSTATLQAVSAARARYSCPVLGVTGDRTSPLAGEVDALVDIKCGPEDMPFSTVGVSSTVLTLMLLALNLTETRRQGSPDAPGRADLHQLILHLPKTIESVTNYVNSQLEEASEVTRWFLLSHGPSLGVTHEGALKLVETNRIPSSGHEIEAFMHGPIFELHPGYGAWFIDSPGPDLIRSNQLRSFIESHGGIVMGTSQVDDRNDRLLTIPASNRFVAPLLHMVGVQVLAAKLSEARGIDLTIPVFPDFRSALKTKVHWDS